MLPPPNMTTRATRVSLHTAGRLLLVCLVCLPSAVGSAAVKKSSSYYSALESINTQELKLHVAFLADDKREGREAGRRGGREAGDQIAAQFKEYELAPAGEDGKYGQPFAPNFRNILARLEGSDPALKHQYIIVGAHYDHVGYGAKGSSRGTIGLIHNGADDNASGTAALLELAEAFTLLAEPPKRSIIFAAWDAEEKGLLGAKHWAAHPTVPLESVRFVFNMDMVGRLREDKLMVFASRSGYGLRRLVSRQNDRLGLTLDFSWAVKANADHFAFFEKDVPVLMLHTGVHDDYHTERDDTELINCPGMRRVVRLIFGAMYDMANDETVTGFRRAARHESPETLKETLARIAKLPDRLGISWEEKASPEGNIRLTRLVLGSPADKAGLRLGDRLVSFAGRDIQTSDDLFGAVMSATNPVKLVANRPGAKEPLELTAQLDGSPLRLGVTWRMDEAEPGTIILTQVLPGSPAARAGLQVEDRIYQVTGRDFNNDDQFVKLIGAATEKLELLVEHNGRLRIATIRFQPQSVTVKKAA